LLGYFTPNKTKAAWNLIRALSWFVLLQIASLSRTLVFPDCLATTQGSTNTVSRTPGTSGGDGGQRWLQAAGCRIGDAAQSKAARAQAAATAHRRSESRGDEGQLNRAPLRAETGKNVF